MAEVLLTLNAGSSSIKAAVFEGGSQSGALVRGEVDWRDGATRFQAADRTGLWGAPDIWPEGPDQFEQALSRLLNWAGEQLGGSALKAVGHRIVHGGTLYDGPVRINADVMANLERLTPLAPLHEPHNLAPVRALAALRPDLVQVACFDTAFHRTLPDHARRFALPRRYEDQGVRRYGFHGLSYEHMAACLVRLEGASAGGRVIGAHLGSGASLCALLEGRSLDTTMGFTALDGLVMATRCGSLDPGVVLYLQQSCGLDADGVADLLYRRSGLLGVSGLSGDMRTLLASSDPRCGDAVDLFVYRIAREAGGLVSVLKGLDGLAFTGGIGEHAPVVRARICHELSWLGVRIDEGANAANAPVISEEGSKVIVRIIPADEEAVIARQTQLILAAECAP